MVEKTMTCFECKKEFTYTYNPRYKRKFCDKCSAERKEAWNNRHLMTYEEGVD